MNQKSITVPNPAKALPDNNFQEKCFQLSKVADQIYNQRNCTTNRISHSKRCPEQEVKGSIRFPVSEAERIYYNVLCGLAQSEWSCFPAVQFFKTSVTYGYLADSVQPDGWVDNFFIACYCRKFFEDCHPRLSKKHCFYPRVGGCLLSYATQYDVTVITNSFFGSNSAQKLHLSDKLCFPICESKHWFLFVVDLRNKLFAFLDSLFNENDRFHVHVRSKLVNNFKDCWYNHAEGNVDLEDFTITYPPVPKQTNGNDCGIFTVKFMELWDSTVDLRESFDANDILNIRIKLAVSLYFSKTNTVDKSLVKNLYEQGSCHRVCV